MTDLVAAKKAALVRSALGDLHEWATSLRSLANHLDNLSAKAERAASKEFGDA